MSVNKVIMNDLKFLYGLFMFWFIVFITIMSVTTVCIFREIRAFNECASVDDRNFTACYELHK